MNAFIGPIGILLSLVIGLLSCHAQVPRSMSKVSTTALAQEHGTREALLAKSILALLKQHHLRVKPLNDDTATLRSICFSLGLTLKNSILSKPMSRP